MLKALVFTAFLTICNILQRMFDADALSQAFMPCASIRRPLVFTVFRNLIQQTAEGCLTLLAQDALSQPFMPFVRACPNHR